jgi:hypothetical protein
VNSLKVALDTRPQAPAIERLSVDDRILEERYGPEQIIAAAIVIGVLILALFGLVLWHGIHKECWQLPNPGQSCTSESNASGATWSPGGVGAIPKSRILQ